MAAVLHLQGQQNDYPERYPFRHSGMWGYLDVQGGVAIPAIFRVARPFSEGLAAVRDVAYYGYIDTKGYLAIPTEYDRAFEFHCGLAKVYKDGRGDYIDRSGKAVLGFRYRDVSTTPIPGIYIAHQDSCRRGLVNSRNKVLLDFEFEEIAVDASGVVVVRYCGRPAHSAFAVYDTKGKVLVKPGTYHDIRPYHDGLAAVVTVDTNDGGKLQLSYIDTNGKLRFTIAGQPWYARNYGVDFQEGLATVWFPYSDEDKQQSRAYAQLRSYCGGVDTFGRVLFKEKAWENISAYDDGRAFAKTIYGKFWLIDRRGRLLGTRGYDAVYFYEARATFNPFQGGIAFVESGDSLIALDTLGLEVWAKPLEMQQYDRLGRVGDFLYYADNLMEDGENPPAWYGFWNVKTGTIVEPTYNAMDDGLGRRSLMQVTKHDRLGWVNENGLYYWQEAVSDSEPAHRLNVDEMQPSCYVATWRGYDEFEDTYVVEPTFKPIRQDVQYSPEMVSVVIDTHTHADFPGKRLLMSLHLANLTDDTVDVDAMGGKLFIQLQAKDRSGTWKAIERPAEAAAFDEITLENLPPMQCWTFEIPVFAGGIQTEMRAKWTVRLPREDQKEAVIYSDPVPVWFNPGQFLDLNDNGSNRALGWPDPQVDSCK